MKARNNVGAFLKQTQRSSQTFFFIFLKICGPDSRHGISRHTHTLPVGIRVVKHTGTTDECKHDSLFAIGHRLLDLIGAPLQVTPTCTTWHLAARCLMQVKNNKVTLIGLRASAIS